MRAKLFSAAAASRAMPSSKSWSPETESNTPASLSGPRALWSSLHAVSYCFFVRGCPKSYIRANLSRILRLRTKARAAAVREVAFMANVRGRKPRLYCKYAGQERFKQWYWCPFRYCQLVLTAYGRRFLGLNSRFVFFQPASQLPDLAKDSE